MSRLPLLVAAAVGLLFPLGLALAVYVASAASLDEPAGVRVGTQPLGQVTATVGPTQTARATTGETTTQDDDRSGRCDEPEHRSDPDCVRGAATGTEDEDGGDEASGQGRGRGRGSDDSDNSGSGGSGGGEDSSGKGSGGGDD